MQMKNHNKSDFSLILVAGGMELSAIWVWLGCYSIPLSSLLGELSQGKEITASPPVGRRELVFSTLLSGKIVGLLQIPTSTFKMRL